MKDKIGTTPRVRVTAADWRRRAVRGAAVLVVIAATWAIRPRQKPPATVAAIPAVDAPPLEPRHSSPNLSSVSPLPPADDAFVDGPAGATRKPGPGTLDTRLAAPPTVVHQGPELSKEARERMEADVKAMVAQIQAADKERAERESKRPEAAAQEKPDEGEGAATSASGGRKNGRPENRSSAAGRPLGSPYDGGRYEPARQPALDYFEHGRKHSFGMLMLLAKMKPRERRALLTRLERGDKLLQACDKEGLGPRCRSFVAECAKDRLCSQSLRGPTASEPRASAPNLPIQDTAALAAVADTRAKESPPQTSAKDSGAGAASGGARGTWPGGGGVRFGEAGSAFHSMFLSLSRADRDKLEAACNEDRCEFWDICKKAELLYECMLACKMSRNCILPSGRTP